MSTEFKITPPCGRPESFNQESECPIASESFEELMKVHFKNKITPYLVALIEDSSKNATLYDLKSIRNWFIFKEWKADDCKNPKTKQVCEKIYVLGIDNLGAVTKLEEWSSLQGFKGSSYKNEDELKILNEIQPEPMPEQPLQEDPPGIEFLNEYLPDPIPAAPLQAERERQERAFNQAHEDMINRRFQLPDHNVNFVRFFHRFAQLLAQGFQVVNADVNLVLERPRIGVNFDENQNRVPEEILEEQEAMEEVD